jgi:hypothetical protein
MIMKANVRGICIMALAVAAIGVIITGILMHIPPLFWCGLAGWWIAVFLGASPSPR